SSISGRVDEVGGLDHAQLLYARVTEYRDGYGAVFTDGKGLHILRQLDARLQGVAVGGDDPAIGIQMEAAITGITDVAVGHQDLEEAAAVDGHVQRLLGGRQGAGSEDLLGPGHAQTGTQLQARRRLRFIGALRTVLALYLIHQVLVLIPVTV